MAQDDSPADKALGAQLRQMRLAAGLTLAEAGQALGVSYQQVQKYEKGLSRLSATSLPVLARLYRTSYQAFFECPAPLSPSEDPAAHQIYRRLIALKDEGMKHKISRIVAILAP